MICPNCNKEIADGSVFCTECGSNLTAEVNATPTVNATNPDVIVVGGVYSAKMRGLSKKQFLATEAPAGIRKAPKTCLILFGVLVVLILITMFTFSNTEMYNLPIIKLALSDSEVADTKEEFQRLAEEIDDIEEEFEDVKDDFTKKDQKIVKKFFKAAKKIFNNFSISSLISIEKPFADMKKLEDVDELDLDDFEDSLEELQEVVSVFKAVRTIAYILGIAVILLLFVSAYFMRTGFAVLSAILYVPVCLIAINVVLGLLILAVIIALAVFTRKVNRAWKRGI